MAMCCVRVCKGKDVVRVWGWESVGVTWSELLTSRKRGKGVCFPFRKVIRICDTYCGRGKLVAPGHHSQFVEGVPASCGLGLMLGAD